MQVKQESVMARMPDWQIIEDTHLIPQSSAAALNDMHGLSVDERAALLEEVNTYLNKHTHTHIFIYLFIY